MGGAAVLIAALPACYRQPDDADRAMVALTQSVPATPAELVNRFLTHAAAGDPSALDVWSGSDAEGRAALASVRSHAGGVIVIGTPANEDAGPGQLQVTVPFTIGGIAGRAVLHKVGDAIDSDHAHDWRIRTLTLLPHLGDDVAVPPVVDATYDCTPAAPELRVRFDNRADTATLMLDGRTVRLMGQRPASGIWYVGDGYELRGKGRQARLALPDGSARDCLAR